MKILGSWEDRTKTSPNFSNSFFPCYIKHQADRSFFFMVRAPLWYPIVIHFLQVSKKILNIFLLFSSTCLSLYWWIFLLLVKKAVFAYKYFIILIVSYAMFAYNILLYNLLPLNPLIYSLGTVSLPIIR